MITSKINYLYPIIIAFIGIYSCTPTQKEQIQADPENPLHGSWEMKSIHWITADTTYSIHEAQPGLFILEENRYSTMWTPTRDARVPFENLSQPTEEETIAGFRSVVFNGGSYEMTDSTLTTTATIAKVPGFEGGIQFYRFSIEGDELSLTMFDETYPNGSKPEWFGKYETKFVYTRAK